MLNANKLYCYGFGWDRVKFIHRGLSDAVFCIFGENNGVKKSKFVAVAEQCLHRPKVFSLLTQPCQQGDLGNTRSWERTQPRQLIQTD